MNQGWSLSESGSVTHLQTLISVGPFFPVPILMGSSKIRPVAFSYSKLEPYSYFRADHANLF